WDRLHFPGGFAGRGSNTSPAVAAAGARRAPSVVAVRALRVAARRRPELGPAGLTAFWGGHPRVGVASGLLLMLGLHWAVALWRSCSLALPEPIPQGLSRRLWSVLREGGSSGSLGSQRPPRCTTGGAAAVKGEPLQLLLLLLEVGRKGFRGNENQFLCNSLRETTHGCWLDWGIREAQRLNMCSGASRKEEGEVEADRAVPEEAESSEPSLIHPLPRCWSYIPPEDLQSCLECHVREVFGPSVPEDWQQAPLQENRLKYRLLARLAAELGHAVPNSQLHRVRCAGDMLGFYRTPVKDSTEIDELAAAELPPNLKIIRSGDSPHAAFLCLSGAVGQQQSPLVGVKSVNFSNKGSLSFAHVWLFLFCSFFPADQFLRGTGAAWALPAAPCPFPAAGNQQDPVGINKGTISSFYFAPLC
ncbi:LOW QUALITY PROTEIN: uncharacterized protein, partial [Taeniopygia guttata]|uniref:LOW QUALITY PROTEIN: uncharacterized protein n=1 Tax=Taeniopygia guttata TaxID=59729 RepID=UPI003BB8716C